MEHCWRLCIPQSSWGRGWGLGSGGMDSLAHAKHCWVLLRVCGAHCHTRRVPVVCWQPCAAKLSGGIWPQLLLIICWSKLVLYMRVPMTISVLDRPNSSNRPNDDTSATSLGKGSETSDA